MVLSRLDNEKLTRVGAGTPMGDTMRRYWLPALLCDELPEPDCPPVRVKLLGEDLVAFRDSIGAGRTAGRVLPPPPHVAVAGPQRRGRAALRLPRLEVRPGRQLPAHDERAGGQRLSHQGQGRLLPGGGNGRRGVGLHGPGRPPAAPAPFRVDAGAGQPPPHHQEPCRNATGCKPWRAA